MWTNPKVLDIISKIAGVELVPQFDFEIGHINISINTKEAKAAEEKTLSEHAHRQADVVTAVCPWEGDAPIVDWHTDSYPFVCVTMLSDCTGMVGGETALRKGDGTVMKVRGPVMVRPDFAPPITYHVLTYYPGQRCHSPGSIH